MRKAFFKVAALMLVVFAAATFVANSQTSNKPTPSERENSSADGFGRRHRDPPLHKRPENAQRNGAEVWDSQPFFSVTSNAR